jgi:orotate phosphoribosyltransferase
MPSDRNGAVAAALLEIGGVGFRVDQPITFKSGILSPVYCDNRTFPFWPAQWKKVIEGFAALADREQLAFDVIGGIEAAGIPHSAALGYALQRPSIFVRKQPKEHGRKARIEGGDVQGKRVLLIEDLVTTGSSSLSGVQALREAGAVVTDCLAIISYGFREAQEAFATASVRLHTLTDFETVLAEAARHALLTPDAAGAVRDWLADPHGWATRRGAA